MGVQEFDMRLESKWKSQDSEGSKKFKQGLGKLQKHLDYYLVFRLTAV